MTEKQVQKLEVRKRGLLAELGGNWLLLRGTAFERYSACARPNCKCHKGERHGPRNYVAVTQNRRQRQHYVPVSQVEAARAGVGQFHRAMEIIDEITQITLTLRCSAQAVYIWIKEFILKGLESLRRRKPPGRPSRLTGKQKKKLAEMIDAGPEACGYPGACWRSPMIQDLILREFGKYYSAKYVAELLKNMNFSYQKARFVSSGIDGRFNSSSYIEYLKGVLVKIRRHVILVQDGARYHVSKQTREFFQSQGARLTVYQLPSYSPDYNPIEELWKNVKQTHIHLHYFPTFEALKEKVQEAMLTYQNLRGEVLKLFGLYRKDNG